MKFTSLQGYLSQNTFVHLKSSFLYIPVTATILNEKNKATFIAEGFPSNLLNPI